MQRTVGPHHRLLVGHRASRRRENEGARLARVRHGAQARGHRPAEGGRGREPLSRLCRAGLDRSRRRACARGDRRQARRAVQQRRLRPARRGRGPDAATCSAPSSRPMCSAGTISPPASSRRCGSAGRGGSCSAPRCSGSSRRPIAAPIAPRNSPSRRWPTRSASSCTAPASMWSLIEPGPDRHPLRRARARGLSPQRRSRGLARTATSTAPASPGWRRAASRPSSSGRRRSPPSSPHALESRQPKGPLLRHPSHLRRGVVAQDPADPRPRRHCEAELVSRRPNAVPHKR